MRGEVAADVAVQMLNNEGEEHSLRAGQRHQGLEDLELGVVVKVLMQAAQVILLELHCLRLEDEDDEERGDADFGLEVKARVLLAVEVHRERAALSVRLGAAR